MKKNVFLPFYSIALALSFALLTGCTTFSQDGGFNRVQSLSKERIGHDIQWVKSDDDALTVKKTVADLLSKPLTVNDAVTIALLNNNGLQASYAELGIAEANWVQAGRLSNPTFSLSRLTRENNLEIERKFAFPILNLLTMPMQTKIERHYFEQTQLRVASEVLRIAHETSQAYFSALAAQETVKYMERVKLAAEAGAELAEKMLATGNWSSLQQAQEQAFYSEATAQLAQAQRTLFKQREQLNRLLGLAETENAFSLPDRLPDLPDTAQEIAKAEQQAMQNRLDLMIAKQELSRLAASLSLTKTTRLINVFDLAYMHNTANFEALQTGYEIEFQIPLFDWGGARVAKSEAIYMQAVNRTAELAINARSQVREAYNDYRLAFNLAKQYRDEIIPLGKKISEEKQLRYNGMLISVFELLADARLQAMTVNSAIEALRDYWIAESKLQMAMTGGSPSSMLQATQLNTQIAAESAAH